MTASGEFIFLILFNSFLLKLIEPLLSQLREPPVQYDRFYTTTLIYNI